MTDFNDSGFDPNAEQLFIDPPGWPKVVGILSIIFGSISVFCGLIGVAFMPFQAGMVEGMLNGAPPPPSMSLTPGTIAVAVGSLGLNALLILAGILLINRSRSARKLHLLYAVLFVPVVMFASYNALSVQSATVAWAEQYPDNDMAKGIQQQQDMGINTGLITAIVNLLIGLAWPLFCIFWFGFLKTRHGQVTGQPDDDQDHLRPEAV